MANVISACRAIRVATIVSGAILVWTGASPTRAADVEDFAVFGLEGVHLGRESRVEGAVGSNRTLYLGPGTVVSGDVHADTLRAGGGSFIAGAAYINHLLRGGPAETGGGIISPLALPVLASLDPLPAAEPGPVNLHVPAGGDVELAAGAHGDVWVGRGATLRIVGGDYHLRSLRAGAGAAIRFLGPATLRVARNLLLPNHTTVAGGQDVEAPDVLIQIDGPVAWIGPHGRVNATVLAPTGVIVLGRSVHVTGGLFARRVFVGRYARVETGIAAQVVVPSLIGLAEADALAALAAARLAPGAIVERPSAMVPAGAVSFQDPRADTLVPPGSVVAFDVSEEIAAGGLAVPDSWVGSWQLRLTTLDPTTGSRLALESIPGSICPGDPVGVELVELVTAGLAACSGELDDETLDVVCDGSFSFESCAVDGEFDLDLERAGDALSGTAAFLATATGAGCPDPGAARSFEILAARLSPDPGACTASTSSLGQKFLRHPWWTRLEGELR